MAYSELVKNFNKIREYMREFYVYGFRSREEFTKKSARSYDDERRRMESWLGDYMRFRQTADGKNVFLSINSRISRHNPFYKAWKTKSFTDGDITLHFILFDILHDTEISMTLSEITECMDDYLCDFAKPKMFDESTVRKKLKEYVEEGILLSEKQGKTVSYRRAQQTPLCDADVLDFFSEVAPCGVVGSYLLDKQDCRSDRFSFKHHYITGAMDSEILCSLFQAMQEKRFVTLEIAHRAHAHITESRVAPLRVMMSVQNGRQYLMAYTRRYQRMISTRLDNILSVKTGEVCADFDAHRQRLDEMMPHMWGVSTQSLSGEHLEQVSFTIRYADDERHIPKRLEREKRCGTIEQIDANTCRFTAEVYDAAELIPWMRTFLCRITEYSFSNPALQKRFTEDIKAMYRLYGIEEGGCT